MPVSAPGTGAAVPGNSRERFSAGLADPERSSGLPPAIPLCSRPRHGIVERIAQLMAVCHGGHCSAVGAVSCDGPQGVSTELAQVKGILS